MIPLRHSKQSPYYCYFAHHAVVTALAIRKRAFTLLFLLKSGATGIWKAHVSTTSASSIYPFACFHQQQRYQI
ncbi:uncharacterized protein H6S33_009296 [Morchella sextelata]|uniref:uncharacterized protein n=1 Tax=Morchella sextelata TaxID=1174677 RepID=UPI001D05947A|nr:uncharacterized protein H6S33_009296 [Morchella sextelata]KAH0612916.1 hypothetical protein H6S33_009296 [Morchella sextelata]